MQMKIAKSPLEVSLEKQEVIDHEIDGDANHS